MFKISDLKDVNLQYPIDYDTCSIEDLKKHLNDLSNIKDNIEYNITILYYMIGNGSYINSLLRYYYGLKDSITELQVTAKEYMEHLELETDKND